MDEGITNQRKILDSKMSKEEKISIATKLKKRGGGRHSKRKQTARTIQNKKHTEHLRPFNQAT